ncbi:O-antigen ligase domain-containing protein [Aliikangiella marina]|uniref:O-antigen ligase domain-containing protein n=1 Tax=Aliikangiella marina TaxID=1712262 RepID=A0A545T9A7_9GAMM|nr:O-antigen ligase domain-containing protein [Aliikangiella marina]TQV73785.1 O-antigen ligase domain-containing protein [Aliikangiella marina]
MDQKAIYPQNFEERVVWHSIIWTFPFYLIGALYIVAPAMGWLMILYLAKKLWLQNEATPEEERIRIPFGVWVWVIGMLMMLVALWMGHMDWQLGTAKTIKSSIGWAKGWALMAVFPLIGCLKIRPEIIYRATSKVCLHALMIFPFLVVAYLVGLPQELYISPLKIVGGPGPEFFRVSLFSVTPEGGVRWFLFAPWAPALGFVACIYLLFSLQESTKWMWIGVIGSLLMILMCKSRLAIVVTVLLPIFLFGASNLLKPWIMFQGATVSLFAGFWADRIIEFFQELQAGFRAARADSSRVREALGRIAVDRWQSEAPVWGHGIVERGPHLVEYMPIGSHHSWYGLLFVKGAIGLGALAIPLAYSFFELLVKCQANKTARVGLGVITILFFYTFGENLEILAYLFWPGLIIVGIAHCQPLPKIKAIVTQQNPARELNSHT